jgi:hypothetical protein
MPLVTENFFRFPNLIETDSEPYITEDTVMSTLISPQERLALTLSGDPAVPGGPLSHYSSLEEFERAIL